MDAQNRHHSCWSQHPFVRHLNRDVTGGESRWEATSKMNSSTLPFWSKLRYLPFFVILDYSAQVASLDKVCFIAGEKAHVESKGAAPKSSENRKIHTCTLLSSLTPLAGEGWGVTDPLTGSSSPRFPFYLSSNPTGSETKCYGIRDWTIVPFEWLFVLKTNNANAQGCSG